MQSIYYKLTVPVGRAPPQPGTPVYASHHRRIRILVLTLYLVYTLLQSLYDTKLAGDFFTLLAVTPSTSDREIKSRFRRLAAKYHPDKLRALDNDGTPGAASQQDTHFLLLKTAQDTLLSPALRYAYTRFGPSITALSSPTAPTIRSYVLAGIQYNLLPSYLGNIVSLVAVNYLFLSKWGSYWRYLIPSSIVMVELYFLTHSDLELSSLIPPYIPIANVYTLLQSRTKLSQILPPHLLPYQILTILRKLAISMNIFISQLAPPQSTAGNTDPSQSSSTAPILTKVNQSLVHLHQIALRTDAESTSLLSLQMAPFKGDEAQIRNLKDGMREGMITGAIRSHPEVKEAVARAVQKQNQEARQKIAREVEHKA